MHAHHNKYSYCLNNPLKYTDPSGWAWSTISALNHNQMMIMRNKMHLSQMQMMAEMNRPDVCKIIGQAGRNSLDIEATEGCNLTVAEIVSYLKHMKHILQAVGVIPKEGVDKDGDYEVDETDETDNSSYLINASNITIYYKIESEDIAQEEGKTEWTAYPLLPHSYTSTKVDAINVDGHVYKIRSGYYLIIIEEDLTIDYYYPFLMQFFDVVFEVSTSFLYDQMWDDEGKRRNFEYPRESNNYVLDTRWFNIFYPNRQFIAPNK